MKFRMKEDFEMEKLYSILREAIPMVNFKTEKTLVTEGYIDSFDIVTLISELEEGFGISIPVECMVPENFESAESIWTMICGICEEGKADV